MTNPSHNQDTNYRAEELARATPILRHLGFELDKEQPHLLGERFLMQAVTTESGKKLILLGTRNSDKQRVVIKVTSDAAGAREIAHERTCREALQKIQFAYQGFLSPEELLFTTKNELTIFVQKCIENEKPFIERSDQEQFLFAVNAFKTQESAHATTYGHRSFVNKTFGEHTTNHYLTNAVDFKAATEHTLGTKGDLHATLSDALHFLQQHRTTIEQYSGFLTHTDFVPHNFRINNNHVYLLDHSSLRFGNKYEGWARFINFMALYNPVLEQGLTQYVADNRTPEESLSLKLMRVYKLCEIIYYYTDKLQYSADNLLTLNRARIDLWHNVLAAVLADSVVAPEVIEQYQRQRDSLRSDDEKKRQQGLH